MRAFRAHHSIALVLLLECTDLEDEDERSPFRLCGWALMLDGDERFLRHGGGIP